MQVFLNKHAPEEHPLAFANQVGSAPCGASFLLTLKLIWPRGELVPNKSLVKREADTLLGYEFVLLVISLNVEAY